LYKGAPASVYFSASCGGRTEIPSNVWPGADDPPFLPSRDDDGCDGAPAWTATLSDGDLLRALHASGFRGDRLRDLKIASHNSSGLTISAGIPAATTTSVPPRDLRPSQGPPSPPATSVPEGTKAVPSGTEVAGTKAVPRRATAVAPAAAPEVLVSLPDDDEG